MHKTRRRNLTQAYKTEKVNYFQKKAKNPCNAQGFLVLLLSDCESLCIFMGKRRERYALTREVATPCVGYFRRVCPI